MGTDRGVKLLLGVTIVLLMLNLVVSCLSWGTKPAQAQAPEYVGIAAVMSEQRQQHKVFKLRSDGTVVVDTSMGISF
jgi:hypothetical protein